MTDVGRPAGWYADPHGQAEMRWWDGGRWTEQTHPPAGSPAAFRGPDGPTSHSPRRRALGTGLGALAFIVFAYVQCAT